MQPILVSACLLGMLTRYDGVSKRNERLLAFLQREGRLPVPVCPEQLAGLPTPRPPCSFAEGDGESVLDGSGRLLRTTDNLPMNEIFLRGAVETMKVARLAGCRQALLKERSPSCGVRQIWRKGAICSGRGVTTALLIRNGIEVSSEDEV